MTVQIGEDGSVYPVWSFGDRVRKARGVADLDQRKFAEAIGVKSSALAAWETDRTRPRDVVAVAKRIELLTGIPAAWTLNLDSPPPGPGGPAGGESAPSRARTEDLRIKSP